MPAGRARSGDAENGHAPASGDGPLAPEGRRRARGGAPAADARTPDFKGTLSAAKRLCATVSKAKPVSPDDVVIPVETAPGEVAQVDFGYVGKIYDPAAGRERKAWVFVFVLGFSRHMFARIVFDQKIETWLRVHVEAFEWFEIAARGEVVPLHEFAIKRRAGAAGRFVA